MSDVYYHVNGYATEPLRLLEADMLTVCAGPCSRFAVVKVRDETASSNYHLGVRELQPWSLYRLRVLSGQLRNTCLYKPVSDGAFTAVHFRSPRFIHDGMPN